jgi:hypothetical protein
MTYKNTFNDIYKNNAWGYGSGSGSVKEYNIILIEFLNNALTMLNTTKFFDYGCGDWQYMQEVTFPSEMAYYGFDISDVVLEGAASSFAKENKISFVVLDEHVEGGFFGDFMNTVDDITSKNPGGKNTLIVKDVLQHLPSADVSYFLLNVLPRFDFAILIDGLYSEGLYEHVKDIRPGDCRSMNLADRNLPFPTVGNLELIFGYWAQGSSINVPPWYKNVYFYSQEDIKDHLYTAYELKKIASAIDKSTPSDNSIGVLLHSKYYGDDMMNYHDSLNTNSNDVHFQESYDL